MSTGAYAPDKALLHTDRLRVLREGGQPYPVHLHLIISDLCDLDCPTCAYRWSEGKFGEGSKGYTSNQRFGIIENGVRNNNPNRMLSGELVRSILDDCVKMGTRAVEFTGGGETTIHPQAPELLDYAQRLGLDTALVTNGLHLKRMGETAVRTQWLRISLDAATPATYGRVRPGVGGPRPENFMKALRQIEAAVGMRNTLKTDCTIGIGFVVQKDNWHEIYDACEMARDLGVDNIRISGVFSPEGDAYHASYREAALSLEADAVARFDSPNFRVHGRFMEKLADLAGPPKIKDCWYEQFTTYIGGDACVYRCCVQSYADHGLIGNIVEAGGFKALWDSQQKRDRFVSFDARSCERCQFGDKLTAIDDAVKAPTLPAAPAGIIHPNFV